MKMQSNTAIAIIGAAGPLVAALAKELSVRFRVLLCGGDADLSDALAGEIRSGNPGDRVEVSECPHEAGWEADVIILAIASAEEGKVAARIGDIVLQKTVIALAPSVPGAGDSLGQALPHSRVLRIGRIGAIMTERPSVCSAYPLRDEDKAIVNSVRSVVCKLGSASLPS